MLSRSLVNELYQSFFFAPRFSGVLGRSFAAIKQVDEIVAASCLNDFNRSSAADPIIGFGAKRSRTRRVISISRSLRKPLSSPLTKVDAAFRSIASLSKAFLTGADSRRPCSDSQLPINDANVI